MCFGYPPQNRSKMLVSRFFGRIWAHYLLYHAVSALSRLVTSLHWPALARGCAIDLMKVLGPSFGWKPKSERPLVLENFVKSLASSRYHNGLCSWVFSHVTFLSHFSKSGNQYYPFGNLATRWLPWPDWIRLTDCAGAYDLSFFWIRLNFTWNCYFLALKGLLNFMASIYAISYPGFYQLSNLDCCDWDPWLLPWWSRQAYAPPGVSECYSGCYCFTYDSDSAASGRLSVTIPIHSNCCSKSCTDLQSTYPDLTLRVDSSL